MLQRQFQACAFHPFVQQATVRIPAGWRSERRPDVKLGCTTSAARLTAESDRQPRRRAAFCRACACAYIYARTRLSRGRRMNEEGHGGTRSSSMHAPIGCRRRLIGLPGVDAIQSRSHFPTPGGIIATLSRARRSQCSPSLLALKTRYEKKIRGTWRLHFTLRQI